MKKSITRSNTTVQKPLSFEEKRSKIAFMVFSMRDQLARECGIILSIEDMDRIKLAIGYDYKCPRNQLVFRYVKRVLVGVFIGLVVKYSTLKEDQIKEVVRQLEQLMEADRY